MARQCSVCVHPERDTIDQALVAGQTYREITGNFPLSKSALERHKHSHLVELMAQADAARAVVDAAHGGDLLQQAEALLADAKRLLDGAEADGDRRTAVAAVNSCTRVLDLLGRLAGELNAAPQINVMVQPQFIQVRAAIFEALAAHPEARQAVARALERVG